MSVKVEKLEGNMALLTLTATAEEFDAAMNEAYLKNKNQISVQGFRKGKAPRAMIEKIYGPSVFYEDAANYLIPKAYDKAMEDDEVKAMEIVARPEIDVLQIEKGKEFIFTAKVALKPAVTLGQYKDFDIEKKTAEITDEEIDAELKRVQEQNARTITVEDRAVADGDIAVIDYEGFCDGEAFEGGKGEDFELTIGSHSFIDTFEEQLIGKNIGDECEVNVTFPEQYHSEALAGKPALFKVSVKGLKVKELPELNDEFAEEVSDFDTLAEYREDTAKKLQERKQKTLDAEYQEEILTKAAEAASVDIPEMMVDYQAEQMVNEYAQRMQMQGLSLDMYMQYTGQTIDDLKNQMKEQAKTRILNSLVLEAIAVAENVEITDEDVEAEIEKMAASYQMDVETLKDYMNDSETANMKKDLAIQRALDLISK